MNMMTQPIAKGTIVRIRTTNGGDSIVKLGEDYRPSYHVWVINEGYAAGMGYMLSPSRIKSIELVNNYWTAPMTEAEAEDILERVTYARRNLRRAA